MERSLEVELKYQVLDPEAGDRYLLAPSIGAFVGSETRTVEHEDRYFDTAERALAGAGYAGRIRRRRGTSTVNLKATTRSTDAVHRREELEGGADPAGSLDPTTWPESAARSLVIDVCGDTPLVELATLRQTRRRRDLVDGETTAELSLDAVEVSDRGVVVDQFMEMEIELVAGDAERLIALHSALDDDADLAPAIGSKFERALAAVDAARIAGSSVSETSAAMDGAAADAAMDGGVSSDGSTSATLSDLAPVVKPPAPPKNPGVRAEDVLGEAGRKVIRFHLDRMIAREDGTRLGADLEELHSMRVATRRMRAAWRVFAEGFRASTTKRYVGRLRRVAGLLGAVRDLDVLIEATEAYGAGLAESERAGLEPLVAQWRAQREEARSLLVRGLDSNWYRKWLVDYREFAETEGAGAAAIAPTEPHLVRDTLPSRIWLAYEHVRAFESVLRWADVPTLHELRIAGKRLRYTLEFGREVLSPEAAGLIARVVALQDHLGLLNDADVGATLARSFLVEQGARLNEQQTAAISRYLSTREQEIIRLRRTVGRPWRGVAGLTFRRGLGRVVAAL